MAESGMGSVAIAHELEATQVLTPAVYKFRRGDTRFVRYSAIKNETPYTWCATTVGQILSNRVYIGELASLKTEVVNCKTKQRVIIPEEEQIITQNAHPAIITQELFDRVQEIRANRRCPTHSKRFNLFRGKLFCECCGHPLMISKKQLIDRVADIYICMHHYSHPDVCPQTHRIYHDMLYPYVLQQIRNFAKSMKRRKVNSPIKEYGDVEELTPETLNEVIERIEIGHLTRKSKPGHVIQIYWKLN